MGNHSDNPRVALLEALAVTAELTATELSEGAARVMAADLAAYPAQQVLAALVRCRRELKGRLTIAAIIERLDDGRPGPNEAWAMIPQDERGSVVWTPEMQEAFGVALPLLRDGQTIAARMAFIEAYQSIVARARAEQRPPTWQPSLGHDPATRTGVLEDAVRKGRISTKHGNALLPAPYRAAPDATVALLTAPGSPMPDAVRRQLRKFGLKLTLVHGGIDGKGSADSDPPEKAVSS